MRLAKRISRYICAQRVGLVPALVVFSLLLAAFPASSPGQPPAAPPHKRSVRHLYQKQIEALELQWRDAVLQGDVATLDRLLADDYVGITASGLLQSKQQMLDRMRSGTVTVKKLDISEVKVNVHGETAVVTCRAEVTATQNGVEHTNVNRYTRVYERRAGVWKIVNFEGTRISGEKPRATTAPVAPAQPQ
jgi:ketosteroid isomerase-like protein